MSEELFLRAGPLELISLLGLLTWLYVTEEGYAGKDYLGGLIALAFICYILSFML